MELMRGECWGWYEEEERKGKQGNGKERELYLVGRKIRDGTHN